MPGFGSINMRRATIIGDLGNTAAFIAACLHQINSGNHCHGVVM
jgi:hypothetical protein